MEFRISDTFTTSLAKLGGDEQKAVKTAAFDMQLNPTNPGLKFHKLTKTKDKKFCSVRVSRDIRVIVHRTNSCFLLCYVDHHDQAYRWAERRKLERHPKTGAAQLVEVRETIREIEVPVYVDAEPTVAEETSKPLLFPHVNSDELLAYGVPEEWIADALTATEDTLFALTDHLPSKASEALLELATGGAPEKPTQISVDDDPFEHPDAQRRFRRMEDREELQTALDYPWEKWAVFLHPAQRSVVERAFNGPARVAGSAGTGKTVVALHRAVFLARQHPEANILVTTFSLPLAKALRLKLGQLIGDNQSLSVRITVRAINEVGIELYESQFGKPTIPTRKMVAQMLKDAAATIEDHPFSAAFIQAEWFDVVDAWQLHTWEAYKSVPRLGRKTRLGEKQRAVIWQVFEQVRQSMHDKGLTTQSMVFSTVSESLPGSNTTPFEFAVVDEAQDINVAQLRFLAALSANKQDGLFFAGDLGQRIFQTPFSWKALGVDIRGRSQTLRINYRTSHQIRRMADLLLPPELADVDGNSEQRNRTVSAFNGPEPVVEILNSIGQENGVVADWLKSLGSSGIKPEEIALFVRSEDQFPRAKAAIEEANLKSSTPRLGIKLESGKVAIMSMHLAKGLEFKAVGVIACDDEIVPLQSRMESVADQADLEDVYNTERYLLYVACTRARDVLLVTGVDPASEFLEDLMLTGVS